MIVSLGLPKKFLIIKSIYLKNLKFSKPWWLAGGISIEWIDEILTKIKPDGVDISSSIEVYWT